MHEVAVARRRGAAKRPEERRHEQQPPRPRADVSHDPVPVGEPEVPERRRRDDVDVNARRPQMLHRVGDEPPRGIFRPAGIRRRQNENAHRLIRRSHRRSHRWPDAREQAFVGCRRTAGRAPRPTQCTTRRKASTSLATPRCARAGGLIRISLHGQVLEVVDCPLRMLRRGLSAGNESSCRREHFEIQQVRRVKAVSSANPLSRPDAAATPVQEVVDDKRSINDEHRARARAPPSLHE